MCRPAVYETSSLREADDARRRDAQVEVDLVVGGLDGQARDERDRAWPRVGVGAGGRSRVGSELGLSLGLGMGLGLGLGLVWAGPGRGLGLGRGRGLGLELTPVLLSFEVSL